jgi:hypothetical protein
MTNGITHELIGEIVRMISVVTMRRCGVVSVLRRPIVGVLIVRVPILLRLLQSNPLHLAVLPKGVHRYAVMVMVFLCEQTFQSCEVGLELGQTGSFLRLLVLKLPLGQTGAFRFMPFLILMLLGLLVRKSILVLLFLVDPGILVSVFRAGRVLREVDDLRFVVAGRGSMVG